MIRDDVLQAGYSRIGPEPLAASLGVSLATRREFIASWDALELDQYVALGDRRRRHAVFRVTASSIERLPHRPHYQRPEYNPMFGGIAREFAPISSAVADDLGLQRVLRFVVGVFGHACAEVEVHQFRIDASGPRHGQPAPEGLHRDGVDGVCILAIARDGIEGGQTMIADAEGRRIDAFELQPFEAVLVDDRRIRHWTSPIHAGDAMGSGHRDVLVVTTVACGP